MLSHPISMLELSRIHEKKSTDTHLFNLCQTIGMPFFVCFFTQTSGSQRLCHDVSHVIRRIEEEELLASCILHPLVSFIHAPHTMKFMVGGVIFWSVLLLVSLVHATTVSVSDETEILTALASDNVILDFTNDIYLNDTIPIVYMTSVTLNGNGYRVDGLNKTQCFSIRRSTTVALNDLVIANGKSGDGGVIYIAYSSSVTLSGCTILNGVAVIKSPLYNIFQFKYP
jgi:hypothetical protein